MHGQMEKWAKGAIAWGYLGRSGLRPRPPQTMPAPPGFVQALRLFPAGLQHFGRAGGEVKRARQLGHAVVGGADRRRTARP